MEGMHSFITTPLVCLAATLPICATIAVFLRFYARQLCPSTLRADDWTIVATLVLVWGHAVNTLTAGAIGGVNTTRLPMPEYAPVALRTLYIASYLLVTSTTVVKISILLFYNHFFSIDDRFRIAVRVMMGLVMAWFISSLFSVIFLAKIHDTSSDADRAKHTHTYYVWYISYSGLSVFFDVAILCLPLPMVRSLTVSRLQKLSILGIFWLGAFLCVVAALRFYFLYTGIFGISSVAQNDFGTIAPAFLWSEVEPGCSVVAACLPTYGPFFAAGPPGMSLMRSLRSRYASSRSRGAVTVASATTKVATPNSGTTASNGYFELEKCQDFRSPVSTRSPASKWPRSGAAQNADIESWAGAEAQQGGFAGACAQPHKF